MLLEADVLSQLRASLQSVRNDLGRQGTFKMRVLLDMLLHEVTAETERREKRVQLEAKPAEP